MIDIILVFLIFLSNNFGLYAGVAELVDALVSNTSGVRSVSVRFRPSALPFKIVLASG